MDRIPLENSRQFSDALGDAVVRMWGRLPHDIQQKIFEEALTPLGDSMRSQLAVFLHGQHPRTSAAIASRAMTEPDSLGG